MRKARQCVDAGQEKRCPRTGAEIGIGQSLDGDERGDDRLVSAGAQGERGAGGVRLRANDQETHAQACAKKSALASRFSSPAPSAPSAAASAGRPSRTISNAALPSGLTIMPRKRSVPPPTVAWPPIGVRQDPSR